MADAYVLSKLPKVLGLSARSPSDKAAATTNDKASHARLHELSRLEENRGCADCTSRTTGWAALPHGAFLCINCAQIHRHIGRHISQVKAINTGTYLWYPDEVEAMVLMGNAHVNALYSPGVEKPAQDAPAHLKEAYVRNKYERKIWVTPSPSPLPPKAPPREKHAKAEKVAVAGPEGEQRKKSTIAKTGSATVVTGDLVDLSTPMTSISRPRTLSGAPKAAAMPDADFFNAFGVV